MVVGDEHIDPARARRGDSIEAAYAVVDGDDHRGRAHRGERDDLRREPVAEFEPVRNEEFDLRAHRAQAAHANCAGRGAVGVVIGDDEQPLAALDRIGEPRRCGIDPQQRSPRRQQREILIELGGGADASRRVYPRQHRREPGSRKRQRGIGHGTADDLHVEE